MTLRTLCWQSDVVGDADDTSALVIDPLGPLEKVVGDDRTVYVLAQRDLWPVELEFAAPHQHGAAGGLDGMTALPFGVPLAERAIAEADGPLTGDLGDLVARTPIGAVHEADAPAISGGHFHHGRICALEGDELAVRDQ